MSISEYRDNAYYHSSPIIPALARAMAGQHGYILDPEARFPGCLDYEELNNLLDYFETTSGDFKAAIEAIVVAMEVFHRRQRESRLVFWFTS